MTERKSMNLASFKTIECGPARRNGWFIVRLLVIWFTEADSSPSPTIEQHLISCRAATSQLVHQSPRQSISISLILVSFHCCLHMPAMSITKEARVFVIVQSSARPKFNSILCYCLLYRKRSYGSSKTV